MQRQTIDRVIVTTMPHGRVVAMTKHRRARVRKKWGEALILRPKDRIEPFVTIAEIQGLARYIVLTERCERRVAVHLRRSGRRIATNRRAVMEDRLRRGVDSCTFDAKE